MGKYSPLFEFLRSKSPSTVTISFVELEKILGSILPSSARNYGAWWANDRTHSQAKAWMDANYKVSSFNQASALPSVTFESINSNHSFIATKPTYVPKQNTPPADSSKIITAQGHSISFEGYTFCETPFTIYERNVPSPFLQFRGRTVREILLRKQYTAASRLAHQKYSHFLDLDINDFMMYLVENNDNFYRHFLNQHGADEFCNFALTDSSIFYKRGLYLYTHKDAIMYLGRCRDNFHARFNVNYGKISPRNCYKDGQATNTRMNSKINAIGDSIRIYLCVMDDEYEIIRAEKHLINKMNPTWNIHK